MKQTKCIGKIYGRLKIIKVTGRNKHKKLIVSCFCSCGNKIRTVLEYIQQGDCKSCGCFRKERPNSFRHGFRRTRFYSIYYAMQQRTNNPKTINYHHYGGRGIKLLWKNFKEFHGDMYQSYMKHFAVHGKDTSIDRINNNGDYCKRNCRWATQKEQCNNQRKKVKGQNHKI